MGLCVDREGGKEEGVTPKVLRGEGKRWVEGPVGKTQQKHLSRGLRRETDIAGGTARMWPSPKIFL